MTRRSTPAPVPTRPVTKFLIDPTDPEKPETPEIPALLAGLEQRIDDLHAISKILIERLAPVTRSSTTNDGPMKDTSVSSQTPIGGVIEVQTSRLYNIGAELRLLIDTLEI